MEQNEPHPKNANAVIFSSLHEEKGAVVFLDENRKVEIDEEERFTMHDFIIPDELIAIYPEGLEGIIVTFSNAELHGLPRNDNGNMLHEIYFLKSYNLSIDLDVLDFLQSVQVAKLVETLMEEWELSRAME